MKRFFLATLTLCCSLQVTPSDSFASDELIRTHLAQDEHALRREYQSALKEFDDLSGEVENLLATTAFGNSENLQMTFSLLRQYKEHIEDNCESLLTANFKVEKNYVYTIATTNIKNVCNVVLLDLKDIAEGRMTAPDLFQIFLKSRIDYMNRTYTHLDQMLTWLKTPDFLNKKNLMPQDIFTPTDDGIFDLKGMGNYFLNPRSGFYQKDSEERNASRKQFNIDKHQIFDQILCCLYREIDIDLLNASTKLDLKRSVTLMTKIKAGEFVEDWGQPHETIFSNGQLGGKGSDYWEFQAEDREKKRLEHEADKKIAADRRKEASSSFLPGNLKTPKKGKKKQKRGNNKGRKGPKKAATNKKNHPPSNQKKKPTSVLQKPKEKPLLLEDTVDLDVEKVDAKEMSNAPSLQTTNDSGDELPLEAEKEVSEEKKKPLPSNISTMAEKDETPVHVFVHPKGVRNLLRFIKELPPEQVEKNRESLSSNDWSIINSIFKKELNNFTYENFVSVWEEFGVIKGGKSSGSHRGLFVESQTPKSQKKDKTKTTLRKLGGTFKPHGGQSYGPKTVEYLQSALWFAGVAPNWVTY